MTVQQLIDRLQRVENQGLTVYYRDDYYDKWMEVGSGYEEEVDEDEGYPKEGFYIS